MDKGIMKLIIQKYLDGKVTPEEKIMVLQWFESKDLEKEIKEIMSDHLKSIEKEDESDENLKNLQKSILNKILQQIN